MTKPETKNWLVTQLAVLDVCLRELQGLELLDYTNRNHLVYGGSPGKLSEEKQEIILAARKAIADIGCNIAKIASA